MGKKQNDILEAALAVVRQIGGTVVETGFTQRGHQRVRFRTSTGASVVAVLPSKPGCYRSELNVRSTIRRAAHDAEQRAG